MLYFHRTLSSIGISYIGNRYNLGIVKELVSRLMATVLCIIGFAQLIPGFTITLDKHKVIVNYSNVHVN